MSRTDIGKRIDIASLQSLPRRVKQDILAALRSMMVLQVVLGVSQVVNTGLSRSQVLARTLLLDGQQRLREILSVAPCLRLQLGQLMGLRGPGQGEPTAEDAVAQALAELCLGLLLKWTARRGSRRRAALRPAEQRPSHVRFFPVALPRVASVRSSPSPYLLYRI